MAYNLTMTILGYERDEAPIDGSAPPPAGRIGTRPMAILDKHAVIEKNATLLLVGSLVVVTIGGIVEIAPLFYLENTIEKVEGMRPYSPLELEGRNIYVREGCYVCHSQMIRPSATRWSATAITVWPRNRCTIIPSSGAPSAPGLTLPASAIAIPTNGMSSTLIDPRSVVPESIMPSYGFLKDRTIDIRNFSTHLVANANVGVPYTEEMIANAAADMAAQADPNADTTELEKRYPKAKVGDFDGDPQALTEMDALVAYLQMLGTLVDFSTYDEVKNAR
jgi:cytochrome c oxidase cbb3-type subunit 2